ncbi:MAG: DUF4376 domain-containing protein [Parafilimonas terrae]|nr:DUF4376 domain-containing protein [Parafilimonas terrae]
MPDPQPTPVEVFGEEIGGQFVACGPEVQQGWVLKGKKFSAPAPTPAAPALDLAAYISDGHKTLRDGGVQIGGMRIATDAESRGLIDGAYALSQAQPEAKIDFKAASGWVTVDAQTIQTIALAVGQWVQLCYSAYRRLDEARAAGTVTTTDEVDAAYAAVALPG